MSEFTKTIYKIDFAINDWIAEHLTASFLDPIMKVITFLGNTGWFFILVAVVFLCFKKTRRFGVAMAISMIISTLATNVILKPLIARPRPWTFEGHEHILDTLIIAPPSDFSFPSGHTTISFSAAFSLFWQNKKAGAPGLVLATLIAFSRLYFYVHFPTDILAGILVGFLASICSRYLTPYAYKGANALKNKIAEAKKSNS